MCKIVEKMPEKRCDGMQRGMAGLRPAWVPEFGVGAQDLLTTLATLFHIEIDVLAKSFSAVTIAMTIRAAIKPYSTAVAPLLSRANWRRKVPILCSRSSVPWSGALG